jgi:alkylated DNA repair dioxygenase AlkB
MYDRVVDVPRLTHFYGADEPLPDGVLEEAKVSLNERYSGLPGGPLCSVGVCLYRDGRDSVAWHGDRVGRGSSQDTVVAILTLGSTRRFSLRPRGGGRALPFDVGAGDLLVMGGSCQRTWEHCVTKTSRAVGVRVSVQFRQRGVR